MTPPVPFLPESAPFSEVQRAYLNGLFAGWFASPPGAASPDPASPAPVKPAAPLTILFGSQTGTSEALAKRLSKEAARRGFVPAIHDLSGYPIEQLPAERNVLVVTSTYGDGEPPDNAKRFWELLTSETAPALGDVSYSVCALGDSNYPKFCGFGKDVDERLAALGGRRIQARAECDVDYDASFAEWMNAALAALSAQDGVPASETALVVEPTAARDAPAEAARYDRGRPFAAALLANRMLNGHGSAKETRHFEISLAGSGLDYEVGDALGVYGANCPALVEEVLAALRCGGEEMVAGRDGFEVPLREALLRHYEITRIPPKFFEAMAERSGDELLRRLVGPDANGALNDFLLGREIIDLLLAHPDAAFAPAAFVALLKKLQPRLYSISSSPKAHAGQVHLTVGVVRYESLGRGRKGVCSTFLADRISPGAPVPVFVHANQSFRLPPDPAAPVIMVGPGTGVAPFRAFLEERRSLGAPGRNWLLFGDQRSETDFLYRNELETMLAEGTLTRLDTAFSRDRQEKVYVQQRMMENAALLYEWLEEGARFYVCGDAGRMAKDVDAALHRVVALAGRRTPEQAADYVRALQSQKRYQRDVY